MGRLLLVDDEPGIRSGLARFLRLSGHDVREAGGVNEAVGLIEEEEPEIIITDLRMEDGSGIDLLLKADETIPGVSSILITGYLDKGLLGNAPEGMEKILEKPVRPADLREAVAGILKSRKPFSRVHQPKGTLKKATVSFEARAVKDLRLSLWGEEENHNE